MSNQSEREDFFRKPDIRAMFARAQQAPAGAAGAAQAPQPAEAGGIADALEGK